ncbi:GTP 3',8-cyclase MoaA [Roseiconus nitratireducens]|uniref:GTP 3',8-cyclase n=1 Tax=Roseiconus nitratireducens TaxID=2605748 RepID=A0A5M6CX81_9BACT|nr:GTP 3',8-cyclase MoaA [Roseiconus nitratireducens]KAA5539693.1 GTP 3',8-cyclase MoaA [Roseiconus nitratireducens]
MLQDRFGRLHTSLRVSVTDRCNLRCTYCMPAETPIYQHRRDILSFEEITRFVQISASLGVDDVRLTGGEPLVRSEIEKLVAVLVRIDGIKKVSLTSNGILLGDQAAGLADAGLRSVNVSLDAMDESAFRQVTRRPGLDRVLDGIQRAIQVGLSVKINAIAMRGFTEHQLERFANYTSVTGIPIRFIEFMPLDSDGAWDPDAVLSGDQILQRFRSLVGPLTAVPHDGSSPATDYVFPDGIGRIGVIPSVTRPFCDTCNRFRLTADGQIRNCLFGEDSADVRAMLRSGATDEQVADLIRTAVAAKKAGHGTDDLTFRRPSRPMYAIGG